MIVIEFFVETRRGRTSDNFPPAPGPAAVVAAFSPIGTAYVSPIYDWMIPILAADLSERLRNVLWPDHRREIEPANQLSALVPQRR